MKRRNWVHSAVSLFLMIWGAGELAAGFLIDPDHFLKGLAAFVAAGLLRLPARFARIGFLELTPGIHLFYTVYILLSIFFGSILGFYIFLPHWDSFLHFLSGILFSLIGLILFFSLVDDEEIEWRIQPVVPILFAIFFAAACAVVWEFYEFAVDSLVGMNMQRWRSQLSPAEWAAMQNVSNRSNPGLIDTMEDLLAAALGSLLTLPLLIKKIRKSRSRPGAL